MPAEKKQEMVMSYIRVRIALGILGISLPFTLLIAGWLEPDQFEPTISDFFHTTYRDLYVGTLCAIGIFLISYRGYAREPGEWIDDDWLATLAGAAAFGMAFLPTDGATFYRPVDLPPDVVATFSQKLLGLQYTPVAHYLCALIFFSALTAMCFFKFAKTEHLGRRRMYRLCGWTMLLALLLTMIAVYFRRWGTEAQSDWVEQTRLIFLFESVGVLAFGFSWLVKAKADELMMNRLRRKASDLTGG